MSAPTLDDVASIVATMEPVVRNLQITQCYSDLAHAAARVVGSGANWCAFATWASKQAGHTIRGEDLAVAVRDRVAASPDVRILLHALGRQLEQFGKEMDIRTLREKILHVLGPEAAIKRASDAVVRGNLKVFEEIGSEFARFLASFQDASSITTDRIASFCEGFRDGEPPEGQRLLREAFMAYGESCCTEDETERVQTCLLGNVLIGLHEQIRLQPEITAAMNASLGDTGDLRKRVLQAILPGFWLRVRLRLARILKRDLPLDAVVNQLIERIQQHVQQITTQAVMTLHLPQGRTLSLGRDVDQAYPETLLQLQHPGLVALLGEVDPTPGSTSQSAAVNWSDLQDRMHFITELFRCYHEWQPLFEPPFTPRQVAQINAGRRPEGWI